MMKIPTAELEKRYRTAFSNVKKVCRAHQASADVHDQLKDDLIVLESAIQQAIQSFGKLDVPPKENKVE
jgi:hypothetical protein